jgi:hypothetical protein
MRNVYKISFRKPEVKRPHGKSIYLWEESIQMFQKDIGCEEEYRLDSSDSE